MKKYIITLLFMIGVCVVRSQGLSHDTTFRAEGNPIIKYKYTADPAAMVHKGKLYLYTGHDVCPLNENRYVMNEWLVFSTEDMKTWTEHPVPLRTTDFAWSKGDAWASQVIERNGKFYWYVAVNHSTIPGMAIGVAISDSPVGPFKDAKGAAIITTQYTKISWDDIDPTVMIDDDGQAYLFWGNTQCYYVKLKENMIDTIGPIVAVANLPRYTEAPWIHKYKDWYYLSYATEFPEKIAYSMSKKVTGPWEYKGILNELAGNSNTNHQAIVEFKGKWYFIYHNGGANGNGGSFHRSVCIDRLFYNVDGTMKRVQMTTEGVSVGK
jgi:beta-xylosidase